jgi:thioredoxin-dependent peroxiredoxin
VDTGDLAPDFDLPDETGRLRKLSGFLSDGPVVLFFYPAAMTMGCTTECRHFRDLAADFRDAGAQRVGISRDAVAKQRRFSETNAFDFPLLSDEDGAVAKGFGVHRSFGLAPTKRTTFVIGRDRRILRVIRSELNMRAHADRALEVLRGEG